MEMTLRIKMDGSAFEENPEFEAKRVLERVADQLSFGETSGVCMDTNGNTVGGWEIVGD